jgi:uncharacterized protein with PQ loop repeat
MFISFSMFSFSSIKIKFSFWLYSPIFYQNITYHEGEIKNKYVNYPKINLNIYKQFERKIKKDVVC